MPKKIAQVKANLNELSGTFITGIILLGLISLVAIFFSSTYNFLIALLTLPGLLLMLVSAVLGRVSGRVQHWFIFGVAFIVVLETLFLMALIAMLRIQNAALLAFFWITLAISCFLSWRWGAGIYNPETMKVVLVSKRIDVQNGTYSPFTLPGEILSSKVSKRWFLIANTSGPLLITIAIVVANALGKYSQDLHRLWGGLWGYIVVVLLVGCVRAALGEYGWIYRWEKETGRKMYISYVVDWREYKKHSKQKVPGVDAQ